jgi:5-methylcytosine-specific restriction endonuclease McrA
MKTHVSNYFQAFGYEVHSWIACEICGRTGQDIHHIEPRSKFGSKNREDMDKIENLVCLCRKCHDDAHGVASRDIKIQLKEIVKSRSLTRTI